MSQMNSGQPDEPQGQMQQSATFDADWTPPQSRRPVPALAHPAPARSRPLLDGRLSGPGGCYNIGNALGLLGGVALAIVAAAGPGGPTLHASAAAAVDHLAGSGTALCITAAMLIFFASGEAYHRAWANGFPPDATLNRWGDLSSGVGALALGAGLFLLGQPILAATAGLLHALGKFGSALARPVADGGSPRAHAAFRLTVAASRLPALALVFLEIAAFLATPGAAPVALAAPVLLTVCYLLWLRADILLLRS